LQPGIRILWAGIGEIRYLFVSQTTLLAANIFGWKSNAGEMSDCRRFSGLAELHWPAKHLISGAAKGQSLSNLGLLVQRFRFE